MRLLSIVILAIGINIQGCEAKNNFPENQKIPGPIEIGSQWQVIELDEPLQINREGVQGLHIVVDPDEFSSNFTYGDDLSNDLDHYFDLRNESGELVAPEVVIVAQDGTEIELSPISNIGLDEGGLTVGMGLRAGDIREPSPPFPEGVKSFTSFRVKSDVPFTAEYLWWLVEHHPDMLH
ncbi:hypothetical protein ACFOZ5_08910 [Marinobacter lacisalsi]|uniref:Lipoprotein n=1 Tax=Marinobacter lacisalsi TaxID=475979 RepID=A0ABV8QFR4_9GAMM